MPANHAQGAYPAPGGYAAQGGHPLQGGYLAPGTTNHGPPPPDNGARGGGGRGGRGGRGGGRGRGRGASSQPGFNLSAERAKFEDKRSFAMDKALLYNADEFYSGKKWEDEDADLNLKEEVVTAATNAGLEYLSIVQSKAIPIMMADNPVLDVIVQAKTGSGKTAAFVAPLLSKIDTTLPHTQAVVVVPTYELIDQTCQWIEKLGSTLDPKPSLALGMKGSSDFDMDGPVTAHIVVATARSLEGHLKKYKIEPRGIKVVVVDEADHMMKGDKGALKDAVARLRTMSVCQFAFFSATYGDIEHHITKMLPGRIVARLMLKNDEVMVDEIAQVQVRFRNARNKQDAYFQKSAFLIDLLKNRTQGGKVMIFVQSKPTCAQLVYDCQAKGIPVSEFSSNLLEVDRLKRFREFLAGKTNALISTDVLARGVDVSNVTLVVNFEMPYQDRGGPRDADVDTNDESEGSKQYVHRIGRTGRFGAFGVAVSLISNEADRRMIEEITHKYGQPGMPLIHEVTTHEEVYTKAEELHALLREKREKRLAERKAQEEKEEAEAKAKEAANATGDEAAGGAGGPGASTDDVAALRIEAVTINDAPPADTADQVAG